MGYKIVEENKDDFKLSRIEQNDSVIEFTIERSDAQHQEHLRLQKEWEAQISLCKATMDNVARNHKEIVELDPVKQNAAKIYLENKERVESYEPKLVELKKAIDRYVKQRKEIFDSFGWKEVTNNPNEDDGKSKETAKDVSKSK